MTERLIGIQVLRGVAAMLVTVHHFCLTTVNYGASTNPVIAFMGDWGQAGVDIFFCISGFVMLVAVSRGAFDPVRFLARRVIRIYPMYWVATALLMGMIATISIAKFGTGNSPLFDPRYLLESFLLWPTQNPVDGAQMPILAQGWTLSYEMLFYVLVAAFVWMLRNLPLAVIGMTVAMIGLSTFGGFLANPIMFEFIFGAVIFLITRRYRSGGWIALLAGIALLPFGDVSNRVLSLGIPAALIIYGLAAIEAHARYPRVLTLIGDASYSLYLTHGFLTYLYAGALKRGLFPGLLSQVVAIIIGTALAVLMGIAFWLFLERRLTVLNLRSKTTASITS